MKEELQKLRNQLINAKVFSPEVIQWLEEENVWNIWVPKEYGGLGFTLVEGLKKLKTFAEIDGSIGWTVTLCSGANYFVGNLKPEVAKEIFVNPNRPVCFGGSGAVGGTAEKIGDKYLINGTWVYATGAPYLTHFTLNAKIIENGKELLNTDGSPLIRSFLVPSEYVRIIEDWNTMGLKATATHSFEVKNYECEAKFSFIYEELYHNAEIYKIPFATFAFLTMWVNYLGLAVQFYNEASKCLEKEMTEKLSQLIEEAGRELFSLAENVENLVSNSQEISAEYESEILERASEEVRKLTQEILTIYPSLGIKASREDHLLNHIFRDYFTATQHKIFALR